jgi:hypothetical protein
MKQSFGEKTSYAGFLYLGENFHQLLQACARFRLHDSEFDAHALAGLAVAHQGTGAYFASGNLEN